MKIREPAAPEPAGQSAAPAGKAPADLIRRARDYAIQAHARIDHRRKYTLQPYDVHLAEVAGWVASVTDDPEMVAAAWLHDAVEDTPATFEELEREFGPGVTRLVMDLTDVSRPSDGNRSARKALDLRHTAEASPRAKTVKLADVVSNSEDICRHDQRFARVYLAEMRALLGVLGEGDPTLYRQAAETLDRCAAKLGAAAGALPADGADALDRSPGLAAFFAGHRGLELFTEGFTARHVLEPLYSFDDGAPHGEMRQACERGGCAAVGVRRGGQVLAYLPEGDLLSEGKAPLPRPLLPRQTLPLDAPLADVVDVLTSFACCFVALEGSVVGVIGRRDMEKPIVRMWLFGMILLVEMTVVGWIRDRWGGESWAALVGEARLEKARQLLQERRRRNLGGDLLDCLQFSDKLQLALKAGPYAQEIGFSSASAAKRVVKEMESLRNNLAHGQDITVDDWPQIARMSRRLHQLLRR